MGAQGLLETIKTRRQQRRHRTSFFTLLKHVSIKKARFGSKKERIRHFSYEHTYYDAVFDQKEKKSKLKSGIPDIITEKTFMGYRPFKPTGAKLS